MIDLTNIAAHDLMHHATFVKGAHRFLSVFTREVDDLTNEHRDVPERRSVRILQRTEYCDQ